MIRRLVTAFACTMLLLMRAEAGPMLLERGPSVCSYVTSADVALAHYTGKLAWELSQDNFSGADESVRDLDALLKMSDVRWGEFLEQRAERALCYSVSTSFGRQKQSSNVTELGYEPERVDVATPLAKARANAGIAAFYDATSQYGAANGHYRTALAQASEVEDTGELRFDLLKKTVLLGIRSKPFDDDLGRVCNRAQQQNSVVRVLLVGVAEYTELPRLEGPINDAELLRRVLQSRGVQDANMTVLTGVPVSKANAIAAMRKLVSETGCGDFVFFHHSGHGGVPERLQFESPLGWRSMVMMTEMGDGPEDLVDAALWGVEISEFVTALRNRGADVLVSFDTAYAALLSVQHFQDIASRSARWQTVAQLADGTLKPVAPTHEKLTALESTAGDYAALYATDTSDALVHMFPHGTLKLRSGIFSYALGEALQESETITVRSLAQSVAGLLRHYREERNVRMGAARFEASDADLALFQAQSLKEQEPLDIEILVPEKTRGAFVTLKPNFNFVGRLKNPEDVGVLTVDGNPVELASDGVFKTNIALRPGQNRVRISAFYKNMGFRKREVEFDVVGDLERLAGVGNRYALIIGNKNYEDDEVDDLVTPHADAMELAQLLSEDYGFLTEVARPDGSAQPLVLLDATRADINKAFKSLKGKLEEDDTLVIYYAGHGQIVNDPDGAFIDAYWIPVDGEADDIGQWISSTSLTHRLRQWSAKNILVIADSCYSGAMSREVPDNSAYENLPEQDRRRRLLLRKHANTKSRMLMSSGGTEPVLDQGCDGHSIFSCALLSGLRKIETSVFSASELFRNHVEATVGGSVQQVPQYKELRESGHKGGDVIFSRVLE